MPLIQANHQYEAVDNGTGSRQKITYDFGLLEKKVNYLRCGYCDRNVSSFGRLQCFDSVF